MNENIFNIDVVSSIPSEKTPGTVYIRGCKYADEITDELPENFLIHGDDKEVKDYLGHGVDKEVYFCATKSLYEVISVDDYPHIRTEIANCDATLGNSIDTRSIFITPGHPGIYLREEDMSTTRYYLDSKTYTLYALVENYKENGFRKLSKNPEESTEYEINPERLTVVLYSADAGQEVIQNVPIVYEVVSNINYTPQSHNIIDVANMEELRILTPSFLGVYRVASTGNSYIYNPYDVVIQDYFNINCDVFY